MLGYRPLVYFWIAEFSDGTALAQFDPETGMEIQGHPDWLPSKVDKGGMVEKDGKKLPYREAYPIPQHFRSKQVVRIGWYPFNSELAKKILSATGKLVIPSEVKPVVIELEKNERLVCYRSHEIKLQLHSGGVEYAETVYVLGIKGKSLVYLNENGTEVT